MTTRKIKSSSTLKLGHRFRLGLTLNLKIQIQYQNNNQGDIKRKNKCEENRKIRAKN